MIFGKNRIGYLSEKKNVLLFRVGNKITRMRYRLEYSRAQRLGQPMPASFNDVKEANWIASDHFKPGDYYGTIVLFRCMDRIKLDPPDSSRLWKRLVKGELVILEVPGDHNSMLKEPGAQILAEQLLSYLKPKRPARMEAGNTL